MHHSQENYDQKFIVNMYFRALAYSFSPWYIKKVLSKAESIVWLCGNDHLIKVIPCLIKQELLCSKKRQIHTFYLYFNLMNQSMIWSTECI